MSSETDSVGKRGDSIESHRTAYSVSTTKTELSTKKIDNHDQTEKDLS